MNILHVLACKNIDVRYFLPSNFSFELDTILTN